MIDTFRRDVTFGLRLIARHPGFSAIAVATLAVAIGANTTVFTVVNALLFTPLPVAAPHELARVDTGQNQVSWPNYEDIRAGNTAFSDVVAHRMAMAGLQVGGAPLRLRGEATSSNFLSVLGVPPAVGRTFTAADARHDLVVLADHVWRDRFNGDPSVIGRVLTLGSRTCEVIGVMPPGFRALAPPGLRLDFWMPVDTAGPNRVLRDRALPQFEVVGRLKPDMSLDQATASLRVLATQMRNAHPELPEEFLRMSAESTEGVNAFQGMASLLLPVFAFLALLTVLSGFVLLIGCANIAGLLIGRAAARQREIAMRLALGAGRGRLVRQLLTESLLLAVLGGAAGVLLAIWFVGSAGAIGARLPIPIDLDLRIDRRVLAYALGLSTFTSLLFGLAPAWSAARFDLVSSLKDDSAGSTARQRLRRVMIVGQVAICTALLLWSGLFLRSLRHIGDINPGFDPSGVLLATIMLEEGVVDDERGDRIFTEWTERVTASPGVQSAGLASVVPLALRGREEFSVSIPADAPGTRRRVVATRVSPGWFGTIRIPLLMGRDFTWDDRKGAPDVAVVNDTLARQFWNGEAIGQRVNYGRRSLEVVGVVRDSKYRTIGETIRPQIYLPVRQSYMSEMTLHVRTTDMNGTRAALTREMRQLAPDVMVDVEPMSDAVAVAVMPAQIGAAATGVFGVVAMLLAALGVYGLVSFSVVQRTREIGVRKAIGARTEDILRLVVGGNARLLATGLCVGLGAGVLGAMALRGFLTGVAPMDPLALVSASGIVAGAALLASLVPALRAARVDPLVALRDL
jgi:predicted permease